jgi:DNA-directed RNA polymerase specialized sigma24 family protein
LDQGDANTAVLAMLVALREDQRDENNAKRSTEAILSSVGLSDPEIASLVGTTANAVKKTRQRERERAGKPAQRGGHRHAN